MRIGFLGAARQIGGGVHPELHSSVPSSVAFSAWPSRVGVFPASPVERDLQAIGHLDAGLRAVAAGVDGAVIDSVGDYGLAALRSALAIPVAGAGESGLAAAARHGRFAIVTVWPESMNFVPIELLRQHGLESRCTGICNVGAEDVLTEVAGPGGYLDRIHLGERTVLGQVIAAVDRAAAEGADAVMLGCTCMSAMAAQVASAVRVPVVNPLAEAVRAVLARVEAGAGVSGAPAILTGLAGLVARMVDAVADEADENCPVCAVSALP